MGYYSKRYITVVNGGRNKLQQLKFLLNTDNEYDWDNIVKLVDPCLLSDCDNNMGDGTKWYSFENDITKASNKLNDTFVYALEISEDDKLMEYTLKDGVVSTSRIDGKSIGYNSDIPEISTFIDNRIKKLYGDDRDTQQD